MSLPNKIFLLFLLPFAIYSQVIQKFEVNGNRKFSVNEIKSFTGINSGSAFSSSITDTIKSRVARNYASIGYFNSRLQIIEESPDSLHIDITLNISEGEPSYIKNISFENAGNIDSLSILPSFSFLEGNIYNNSVIEEKLNDALNYYENNGYPFARIIISSVHAYSDSISGGNFCDIFLRLEKKEQNKVDRIEVSGNTKTKSYVITREIRFNPGGYYSQKKIEELPGRLNRLRFFEPVQTPSFYINSKNEGVLLVTVKEKDTNNFDGILGYVPGTATGEKGYLTGLVNINLRNLFGTGRGLSINWQQANRLTQEMELKYQEPWIFGFPFNVSGGLFQRKQDTTYVQRKYQADVEFLAAEDFSASFSIAGESVIPTLDTLNRFSVYNSGSLTTGISLKYDTRDDPYSPTEGLFFNTGYYFSKKRIYGPAQFITSTTITRLNLQRIAFDFSVYQLLFKRHVAALGIHGKELRGSSFEESDLFRLGGTSTLRGYRENQFLGNRIMWTNLEYRLLLTRRSYAFLFLDSGYYLRNQDNQKGILKSEAFNMGYGFGLSIETGVGVLGVSFALAKGDSFSDGKIHFGIINEF